MSLDSVTRPRLLAALLLLALLPRAAPLAAGDTASKQIQEAIRSEQDGDLDIARRGYATVVEAFPRTPEAVEARVRGAELSRRLGDPEEAATGFLGAIEEEPPSPWTARARLGLGELWAADGAWEPAIKLLQSAADEAEPEAGEGGSVARAAGRLLTLIHRHHVRPAAGEPRWLKGRTVNLGGSLKKPVGVAAADDGGLAITDTGADATFVLDAAEAIRASHLAQKPGRPAFDAAGNLYVPTGQGLQLTGNEASGLRAAGAGGADALRKVQSIERGPAGEWFVLSAKPQRLLTYGADWSLRADSSQASGGEPIDLARGPSTRLYVLDGGGGGVTRFDPGEASGRRVVAGGWRRPLALTVDRLGNIYVLDRATRTIELFSPSGDRLDTLGPSLVGGLELQAPEDLAVDDSGRLYIADSKRRAVYVLE